MDCDPAYTVVVRDTTFTLSKSQIETDSPNYFTMCFLGDFREAQTRLLRLTRDPDLFKIIVDHLCGYTVLPLSQSRLPAHMSLDQALANLRADAEFYQLGGLILACDKILNNPVRKPQYIAVVGQAPRCTSNQAGDLKDLGRFFTMSVSPEQLSGQLFSKLFRARDFADFPETYLTAVTGEILAKILGTNYLDEWQLFGWWYNFNNQLGVHQFLAVAESVNPIG